MAQLAFRKPSPARDSRALPSKPLAISARLELPSGGRSVQILELTDRGAHLYIAAPPPVGAPALLKWQANECGLRFDKELAPTVLATCADTGSARIKPVAALDRIRIGTKRREKSCALASPGERDGEGFAWTIALRRPMGRAPLSREALSPAEEMFFYLAPLAHVVRYEEEMRQRRRGTAL